MFSMRVFTSFCIFVIVNRCNLKRIYGRRPSTGHWLCPQAGPDHLGEAIGLRSKACLDRSLQRNGCQGWRQQAWRTLSGSLVLDGRKEKKPKYQRLGF
jgi:hypothetical protein